jgi:cytosine deaminase
MLDLLITNATLPDGRTGMAVAVQGGRIAEVSPACRRLPPRPSMPAATCCRRTSAIRTSTWTPTLSYGLPRVNESGTLLEGIALWGELKPLLKAEDMIERALAYCDWAVARGLLAIRSHVDTSDPSLLPVEAMLEVKKRVASYIDLQLVAFPQDGVLRTPAASTT